jgi:predicted MPP superfamily phosphohydrolase
LRNCPVFAILGNHELRSRRADEIAARFRAAGATVLRNELARITVRGADVCILGLCEGKAVSRMEYIRAVFRRPVPADMSGYLSQLADCTGLRIVLSHFPENFAQIGALSYRNYPFDAMFSGHAHGGQWRFAKIGGLYAPGQGLFPAYTGGLYEDSPALVVSRGLGNSSWVPRVNNRPEIVCVTFAENF